ncbi:conserved hypothetical protein [Histoplasma mississippiense (nom. inval.)]|uniref:conserved hypothetical protein n=1 Tax=Ajellomyces capsulatus (strain NAm1 / WU24) TaxID=2059318 RepID=UPI000157CD9C|nr:conserved hypothetical protein [Histoplasma mississippiense (nom. inval.)]EDN10628.1 conserved hypothetical protein [Histoplasma mississippiense (nom. inval.)]
MNSPKDATPPTRPPHSRRRKEMDIVPIQVGSYTRLEEIGRGSFATVYQGVHNRNQTLVAIKSVNMARLNKKLKDNLKLEINILKAVHHPHIVMLLDCQETANEIHLVMEYCVLGDLSIFIKKRDSLLASALHFLRSRDLVHRDVKPQNLLLNPSPRSIARGEYRIPPYKGNEDLFTPLAGLDSMPLLKLADFGFARSLPSTSLADTLCGSPLYMAPEILRAMERQQSSEFHRSPGSSLFKENVADRGTLPQPATDDRDVERERERAAQEVAFERDYIIVEKRAVEVNAFADELAASPRIRQQGQGLARPAAGVMPRRATTAAHSPNPSQNASSRALQLVTGRPRADSNHNRQSSYERRYGPSPNSATSAISKALNMASGRLFGVGFSPPLTVTKGGRSPPLAYNPFPVYPLSPQGNLVVVGDGAKTQIALDEDTKTVQIIEECATRSDVVYGFAEVKYKQLIPLAPSMQPATAIHPGTVSPDMEVDPSQSTDGGLTTDAIVTLSQEALVLYVKALSLLAKSMDIAGAWWARKNTGEVVGISGGSSSSSGNNNNGNGNTNPTVGARVNNVVQWVRNRFNEVLEKAEFVRLKLLEAQKRLPTDHPSHPSNNGNHSYGSDAGLGLGTSVDQIVVSSGITAEKLIYDRALEMSRTAAINELTGEDLPGCEIAYVTAIRMLEAILENDEEVLSKGPGQGEKAGMASGGIDNEVINGVQLEDRQIVAKLVASIRTRLTDLRKKMALMTKRSSAPPVVQSKVTGISSHLRRPTSPVVTASASPRHESNVAATQVPRTCVYTIDRGLSPQVSVLVGKETLSTLSLREIHLTIG